MIPCEYRWQHRDGSWHRCSYEAKNGPYCPLHLKIMRRLWGGKEPTQ